MYKMIRDLLFVGVGSCLGGMSRYLISLLVRPVSGEFPWGTFIVNVLGSLAIGLLWGWVSRNPHAPSWINTFLIVGFCGGFTTFSTLNKDCLSLIMNGQSLAFYLYVFGSFILGFLSLLLGWCVFNGKS